MKGKIIDVAQKQGTKGAFYVVKADEGGQVFEMLCFDGAIADKKGQEVEYDRKEKDGKYFLNLPKAKGAGGGGGRSVSPDAMYVAYGKDLAVCFLEGAALPYDETAVDAFIQRRFMFFKRLTGESAPAKTTPKAENSASGTVAGADGLKPNPEFHRGLAVKCPTEGGKLRPVDDCAKCDGKSVCFAWN